MDGGAMTESKRVLRPPEAATYTGLSESTLAKRRLKGLAPSFLSLGGRAIGYAVDDLNAWLETCRRDSTSQQHPTM
jgi:predicted DNA-binding transcriptional regulator AlpA